jgi:hyperosmotically inducible periplasmic protein
LLLLTSMPTKKELIMQNPKMLSRLLATALVSLASVAAVSVQAADPATSAAPTAATSGAATGATTATTATSVPAADDATITTLVKAALIEDKQVKALKIKVTTEQGVVKMSGTVPNAEVGKRALQLAASVQGVKDIKSELKLKAKS